MNTAYDQILIVDDDRDLRDLLEQYLTQQGYRTASVGDGVEMENWLRGNEPDLIILDLMLPGEDGLTLAHRLRARGSCPVIMLSARSCDGRIASAPTQAKNQHGFAASDRSAWICRSII